MLQTHIIAIIHVASIFGQQSIDNANVCIQSGQNKRRISVLCKL